MPSVGVPLCYSAVMDREAFLSADARVMRSSLIRQLTGLVNQPNVISFAAGSPNAEVFPYDLLCQIQRELVEQERGQIFQYSVTRGNARLVHAVGDRDRGLKGIDVSPRETILLSGSQQGLDFVGRVLLDPGDAVFVETPSYIGATAAFENFRAKLHAVACDEEGMDIDHLSSRVAAARAAGTPCKFVYVIPNFQNPSGSVWSPARREALYEFACEQDILIFEDDAYGELYYHDADRPSLRPIKALDEARCVIYMSTFSKILAPGLRVAWIHGPDEIVRRIEYCKETGDLCSSTLSQRLILEFLQRSLMDPHVARVREFYAAKAGTLQRALREHFAGVATWRAVRGGLFQWMELPEDVNALELFRASLDEDRVAFIPGEPFFAEGGGANALRLSFSNVKDQNIDIGLSRLSRRIRQARS